MDIHVTISGDLHIHAVPGEPAPELALILASLNRIETQMTDAATALADLQTAVANDTTVDQSIETLVTQLANLVQQANGVSPAAVEALVAQLKTNAAGVVASVTANTPAPPPPPAQITASPTSFTGTVGQAFTGVVTFSGGVTPYAVTNPVLPAGLSMDGSGNITGTYATGSGSGTVTDSTTPTPLTDNFALTFS